MGGQGARRPLSQVPRHQRWGRRALPRVCLLLLSLQLQRMACTRSAVLTAAATAGSRLHTSPSEPAVHTLEELKLSGNHLKGSRPVLSFDK